MMRTRVKICGLTNADDAAAAVRAGADALGVVLAPSPRQVSLEQAARVLASVPPMVARIGVFVDAPLAQIEEAVRELRLTAVQLHGDETPAMCAECPVPVVKAVRVGEGFRAEDAERYEGRVAAILLDTFVEGSSGGTGRTFPWERIARVAPRFAPLVVAGGLTPVNVRAAIGALRPFAVDVSSGVEELPGAKDSVKMEAFVAEVRAADPAWKGGAA